jgi:hypothetical protein
MMMKIHNAPEYSFQPKAVRARLADGLLIERVQIRRNIPRHQRMTACAHAEVVHIEQHTNTTRLL